MIDLALVHVNDDHLVLQNFDFKVIVWHHKSSRKPLKKGCRTLPSADFARYSISASSSGSTQMPLCAMRLVYGWVFRISGVRRLRRSAADALSKPWSTLPA